MCGHNPCDCGYGYDQCDYCEPDYCEPCDYGYEPEYGYGKGCYEPQYCEPECYEPEYCEPDYDCYEPQYGYDDECYEPEYGYDDDCYDDYEPVYDVKKPAYKKSSRVGYGDDCYCDDDYQW